MDAKRETRQEEVVEMRWRWRKPGLTSVRKIDGRTGEKTGVLTVEKIGARIGSWIDGKTDGKIDNSIDEGMGEKIDGSRGVRIIAPMLVASFEDSIERITWLASMAVKDERMRA